MEHEEVLQRRTYEGIKYYVDFSKLEPGVLSMKLVFTWMSYK